MADYHPSNGVDHNENGYDPEYVNLNSNLSAR
jgi:hypothetical protein